MNTTDPNTTSRRQFLKTSTTAALTSTLAAPLIFTPKIRAASPGEILKVGLIGCGGRGNGAAADALYSDRNAVLHAMGDIYADKIESGLRSIRDAVKDEKRTDVPAERRFAGLDAFEKVLHSGVDVVLLTTPPGFRPLHFKA